MCNVRTDMSILPAGGPVSASWPEAAALLGALDAAMLRLMDELSTTMFCAKDTSGRYVAVNEAFVRRTCERSRRDVVGRRASDLFEAQLARRYDEQDEAVLSTGRPLRRVLELILRPGGPPGWFLTSKVAVRGSDGRVVLAAAGPTVEGLRGLAGSFAQARHTLAAASRLGWTDSAVVRLADLRLPGLVEVLAANHDVQDFVDRELGPLLDSPELIDLLESFIANGLNKSSTAQVHHLSRPAVDRRLDQITERLGIDLDDVRAVAGLYVALLALRARGR